MGDAEDDGSVAEEGDSVLGAACSAFLATALFAASAARLVSSSIMFFRARNWASRLSVMVVVVDDRESTCLTDRWKARIACLLLAGSRSPDDVMIPLAPESNSFNICRGSSSSLPSSFFCSLSSALVSSVLVSSPSPSFSSFDFAPIRRLRRPARRRLLSLGAPVAYITRSGSTWNMSPGFNRYPGYCIYRHILAA